MDTSHNRAWTKVPLNHGLLLFALLTGFFLLMRAIGLAHIFYLRAINIVFVFFVIRAAIRNFHTKIGAEYYEDFLDYILVALRTGFIAMALFAGFVALYLDQLDPDLMEMMRQHKDFGGYISPVVAGFIIFMEGILAVAVSGFIYVQMAKSKTVETPVDGKSDLDRESPST